LKIKLECNFKLKTSVMQPGAWYWHWSTAVGIVTLKFKLKPEIFRQRQLLISLKPGLRPEMGFSQVSSRY